MATKRSAGTAGTSGDANSLEPGSVWVYQYSYWDEATQSHKRSTRFATIDVIKCGLGEPIHSSAKKVAVSDLVDVAGGTAVTGIAMAVAGGLFPPAIPFIVAGVATAGAGGVGWTKSKEKEAREKVLAACLNERGYKAYPPN